MGKINKSIRFIGEVVALSTEVLLKTSSKAIEKINKGKSTDKSNELYKLGENLSDNIVKKSKKAGDFIEEVSKEAFSKETKIYGDAKYIYDEDKIINTDFNIEE